MKKILIVLLALFIGVAHAITVDWIVDGETYTQTTCTPGDNITPPIPPTKIGYTFREWGTGYTPIEYIESSGTQWIDTGITGHSGLSVEIRLSWKEIKNTYQMNGWYNDVQIGIDSNGYWWNRSRGNTSITLNTIYNAKLVLANSSATLYVNDVFETTAALGSVNSTTNFYLFAIKYGNSSTLPATERIYGCKIINGNGVLVRDLIPAIDRFGIACMYDRVTRTFFYNSGTDNFIAGPRIQ